MSTQLNEMTAEQLTDIDYIQSELKERTDKGKTIHNDTDMKKLMKIVADKKAVMSKDARELERMTQVVDLTTPPTYIVTAANQERIYTHSQADNAWVSSSISGYRLHHKLDDKTWEMFLEEIIASGHMKHEMINTFQAVGEIYFNPMKQIRKGWTQPSDDIMGPVRLPDCVDILLNSLSEGRNAEREMLEKIIWRKYTHPEDYQIPAAMIYGSGSSGKNTLIHLLGAIYGPENTPTMDFSQAFGQFSGSREGKVVVAIDEAPHNKTDADALKGVVGNATTSMNIKYGVQKTGVPNTAQYFLFTNNLQGSLLLSGGAVDRRYEVLKTKNTLYDATAKYYDIDLDEARLKWNSIADELKDKKTASVFLRYLNDKYGEMSKRLVIFHGEDYLDLLERQTSVIEDYARLIFTHQSFGSITHKTLYEGYKFFLKQNYPTQVKYTKGHKTFLIEIDELIANNKVEGVERCDKINLRTIPHGKERKQKNAYVRIPRPKNLYNTDDDYIDHMGGFRLPDDGETTPRLQVVPQVADTSDQPTTTQRMKARNVVKILTE